MDNLSIVEKTRLDQCEAVISRGVKTFIEVGNALAEIRDSRLYRLNHGTFEEYCRDKWGMSKTNANRMINSSEVISNLAPIGVKLPATESQARPLSSIEPAQQAQVWQQVVETAPEGKITAAHVQAVVNEYRGIEKKPDPIPMDEEPKRPHVLNNSGNNEWYTPPEYIEAARRVMGYISFDPASSEIANQVVGADSYFTEENSALTAHPWGGKVWMNPPYSSDLIGKFCEKLVQDYRRTLLGADDGIDEAIVLVNNATETGWFCELISVAAAVVFPKSRVKFWKPNGETGAPLQGQAVIYFGDNPDGFIYEFSKFGWACKVEK